MGQFVTTKSGAESNNMASIIQSLLKFEVLFWDFDGVIKDSVYAKTEAFLELFKDSGPEVKSKIKMHHESNGGMSRYEKIPLYMEWSALKNINEKTVNDFADRYAKLVFDKVVNSKWVEGVIEYINENKKNQKMYLVTATPQEEIEIILKHLNISQLFIRIFGYPHKKSKVIRDILNESAINKENACMVGDSSADLLAAKDNQIPFVLRLTDYNENLKNNYTSIYFERLVHG